MGEVFE